MYEIPCPLYLEKGLEGEVETLVNIGGRKGWEKINLVFGEGKGLISFGLKYEHK